MSSNSSYQGQNKTVVGGVCLTEGYYEAGNQSKPYSDRWCSKEGQDWSDWMWVPTSKESTQCSKIVSDVRTLGRIGDGPTVCEIFRNRSVLFVGDSLSYQQWESLVYSSGYEFSFPAITQRDKIKKMSPTMSLCYNGEKHNATALYIRNDQLMDPPDHSDNCNYCYPFWEHILNFDIIVFNRGAHIVSTDKIKKQTIEFSKKLNALLENNNKKSPKIYWRTTVPGHPSCGEHTTPSKRHEDELVGNKFGWDVIPEQNGVMVEILSKAIPELRFINAEKMTSDRRDRHNSPSDCLHYCVPGPIDWWNQVLLYDIFHSTSHQY